MNKERLIRAIRSLEYNRTLKTKAEERAQKAEATVKTHLELLETATAKVGGYQVEIIDGEVKVTYLPQDGYQQLRLLESRAQYKVRSEDVLTSQEAEVLQRADKGELPCPRCRKPLRASVIRSDVYNGVVLSCECGFEERQKDLK